MFNDFSEILRRVYEKAAVVKTCDPGGGICGAVRDPWHAPVQSSDHGRRAVPGKLYGKDGKKISLAGTRGNIYDRNGNLLAYNKLSYNVTLQDNGDYKRSNDRNRMLLELVRILNRHGENVEGDFPWVMTPPGI